MLDVEILDLTQRENRVARGLSAKTAEQHDEWNEARIKRLKEEMLRYEMDRIAAEEFRERIRKENLRLAEIERQAGAERQRVAELKAKREAKNAANRAYRARVKARKALAAKEKPRVRVPAGRRPWAAVMEMAA